MVVKSIRLEGFRNYDRISVSFDSGINVIAGDNAQGKTNLLEAIYYLTAGRSFRARSDRELIRFDRDFASVGAVIDSGSRIQEIEAQLRHGRRRQLSANGVRLKTASELPGKLTAVLFCPDDLYLIKDGAAARRKLMDLCLCQLRPRYSFVLTEYHRLYEHKTRILRDHHEKPSLLETLDEFNDRLARMSAELISYRAAFARKLSSEAEKIHENFPAGWKR
jgi:DNA replication and repair protein RecF